MKKHHDAKSFLSFRNLYPSVLSAGITLVVVYVISGVWMRVAMFTVHELLSRDIISTENYSSEVFRGMGFDLLSLLLTLLSVIAGVMVTSIVLRQVVKRPVSKQIPLVAATLFTAGFWSILLVEGSLSLDSSVIGWFGPVLWIAGPALVFVLASRKYLSK